MHSIGFFSNRRGNLIWGGLTLLLTFVPTVLGTFLMEIKVSYDDFPYIWWDEDEGGLLFNESSIGYIEPTTLGRFLLHFPIMNVATQAFYTQKLIKLKKSMQRCNENSEEARHNNDQEMFDKLSSDLLEFKIYEAKVQL